jgi:hypothetical protein
MLPPPSLGEPAGADATDERQGEGVARLSREGMAGMNQNRGSCKIDGLSRVARPKLRPQLSQKIDTTELDEVPIVICEPLICQPIVNGFANVNQRLGLFTNILHVGAPFDRQISREPNMDRLTRCSWLEN